MSTGPSARGSFPVFSRFPTHFSFCNCILICWGIALIFSAFSSCYGFRVKCTLPAHGFEHLAPGWGCCLGRHFRRWSLTGGSGSLGVGLRIFIAGPYLPSVLCLLPDKVISFCYAALPTVRNSSQTISQNEPSLPEAALCRSKKKCS